MTLRKPTPNSTSSLIAVHFSYTLICNGLIAQQGGDGTIIVYGSGRREEGGGLERDVRIRPTQCKRGQEGNPRRVQGLAEPLLKLTPVTDDHDFTACSLYTLSPGRRWKQRAKVTLFGDAAHLMTPHAGEGVNVAMEDALKLADAIIRITNSEEVVDALDMEVSVFEDEMMERATKVQKHSLANTKDMYFNPAAPHAVVDSWVRRAMAQQLGWVVEIVLPL